MKCNELRDGIRQVADDAGLDCEIETLGAGLREAKFTVVFRQKGAKSKDQELFDRLCGGYGLKPFHFGMNFVHRGTTYRVTGVNPRAPKYPISGVRVHDGRGFKFPASMVARLLPDEEPYEPPAPSEPPTPSAHLGGGDW